MSEGRALVLGLGSFGGGLGVTRHLVRRGFAVTVTDLRGESQLRPALTALADLPVECVLGEHRAEDFERADLVVVNPAVPAGHPLVQLARDAGARVTSEIELLLDEARGRVVGVTGTQGKSSTCHILASLLAECGWSVHLGGNIGGSLLERVESIGPSDVVVLELSSYQLEALEDPARAGRRVEAVCVTNVLADHLERHGDLAAYRRAKARILELAGPGAQALLPYSEAHWAAAGDRGAARVLHSTHAGEPAELHLDGDHFRLGERSLGRLSDLHLSGEFQRANALCALGLAQRLGLPSDEAAGALASVRGLPHRLEDLGLFEGRRVFDNGVSSTPDSTLAALDSLPAGVHWLVGGQLKRLDPDPLVRRAAERVAHATCFGASGPEWAERLGSAGVAVHQIEGLPEATRYALARAPRGAQLLFSPACASFDAYLNFRERAQAFRAALPMRDSQDGPEPRRDASREL